MQVNYQKRPLLYLAAIFKNKKMKIIFALIIISLIIALGFLLAFFWAVNSGQYDDDYTPSIRILMEDTKNETP